MSPSVGATAFVAEACVRRHTAMIARMLTWAWWGGTASGALVAVIVIKFMVHDTLDRKSTRLNSSHVSESRMPSSA